MAEHKTIYVGEVNYEYAMRLVGAGHFSCFADVLTYSMRFMSDIARIYGIRNLPNLDRRNLRKINVRMPPRLVEELQELNFAKDSEIYDMALQFYSNVRKRGGNPLKGFREL